MRVLLVFTNLNDLMSMGYHYGLASIAASARAAGHEVSLFTVNRSEDVQQLMVSAGQFQPEVIGFTSVSSQFRYVSDIATLLHEAHPQATMVCGGVYTTIYPECIKEASVFDAIFRGESEHSFVEFLRRLEAGEDAYVTANIAYLRNGRLIVNPLAPLIEDLNILPNPARDFDYATKRYDAVVAPFCFSRGCPFNCAYCSNHAIAKANNLANYKPRFRSVDSSLVEICEALTQYPKISELEFWDDNLGLNKRWFTEFLSRYAREVSLPYKCRINPAIMNEEKAALLKETGCVMLRMGIETGNEEFRRRVLERPISNAQIEKAFQACHKVGLRTFSFNILGAPGETESTLKDTIALNRAVCPDDSIGFIFHPYEGTRLGDRCYKDGLVDKQRAHDLLHDQSRSILRFPDSFHRMLDTLHDYWGTIVCDWQVNYDAYPKEIVIDVGMTERYGEFGYKVCLPLPKSAGSSLEHNYRSRYMLYEDGRELFPYQSYYSIAERGGGRFRHWEDSLLFSSSDNSPVMSNRRKYRLVKVDIPFI